MVMGEGSMPLDWKDFAYSKVATPEGFREVAAMVRFQSLISAIMVLVWLGVAGVFGGFWGDWFGLL